MSEAGIKVSARGVTKAFPARRGGEGPGFVALRELDLDVRDGEFLVVEGPGVIGRLGDSYGKRRAPVWSLIALAAGAALPAACP